MKSVFFFSEKHFLPAVIGNLHLYAARSGWGYSDRFFAHFRFFRLPYFT